MAVTGHRSADGVRVYKEISHCQEEKLSEMIQVAKKLKKEDEKYVPTQERHFVDENTKPMYNFNNCTVNFN